ncbi:MAG: 50S ribosomal protein L31e [Candidatus Woesearchaeota archaeon]
MERSYTIPIRRDFVKVPRYYRAKRAVKAVINFISKHMKTDDVRVGKNLNEFIWSRGIRNPPGKVKVVAKKIDDYVTVELEGFDYKVDKVQTEVVEKATGLKGKVQDAIKDLKGGDKSSEDEGADSDKEDESNKDSSSNKEDKSKSKSKEDKKSAKDKKDSDK